MKNRKFLFGLIILVLVAAIGIGYAAVSKTLTIGGQVTAAAATANDFPVYFENAKVTTGGGTFTIAGDKINATLTPSDLSSTNKTIVATIDVVNTSEYDAKISDFSATLTADLDGYATIAVTGIKNGDIIAAKTGKVTVTITITSEAIPVNGVTGGINVSFDAEAQGE